MTRLSDGKQDDIDWLLKNNSLVKALQFPLFWCGLGLGRLCNHLTSHYDEECLCYSRHVYSTYHQRY